MSASSEIEAKRISYMNKCKETREQYRTQYKAEYRPECRTENRRGLNMGQIKLIRDFFKDDNKKGNTKNDTKSEIKRELTTVSRPKDYKATDSKLVLRSEPSEIRVKMGEKWDVLAMYSFSPFSCNGINFTNAKAAIEASKYPSNRQYQNIIAEASHMYVVVCLGQKKKSDSLISDRVKFTVSQVIHRLKPEYWKNWESHKGDIILNIYQSKFEQDEKAQEVLLSTGEREILDETGTDLFLNWCGGKGKNFLGKILVNVRTLLRKRGMNLIKQNGFHPC